MNNPPPLQLHPRHRCPRPAALTRPQRRQGVKYTSHNYPYPHGRCRKVMFIILPKDKKFRASLLRSSGTREVRFEWVTTS